MDKQKPYEVHDEKRKYPRIAINSPIDILYKMHQLQATIHDISPDGLQIHSDTETFRKINPDDKQISEENSPLLDVTFYIKLYDIDTKINALCKMQYSHQLDDDEDDIICGLSFISFEGYTSKLLDAYFTEEISSI